MALTRRQAVQGAASAALLPSLSGCESLADEQAAARALRRPLDLGQADQAGLMRELVRFATLAPSSHNTQCWTFQLQRQAIVIAPDLSRRCPVVDPDDHHLWVSLGCATENLAQAALATGWHADAGWSPEGVPGAPVGQGAITVNLQPTRAVSSPLCQAITERQCTRGDYDGTALSSDELRALERAGTGQGVHVLLLTERAAMARVLAHVVEANSAQMGDAAFMAELKAWMRFGAAEAQRSGDGLFAAASGHPVLPRWLGVRAMDWVATADAENARYARQVRSSAGIAVFVSGVADRAHWVEVGRCCQRFALQATAMGLRHAFLNQPVEVPGLRPAFATALGLGGQRPDLVMRFGRGPALPLSMRRPVQAVLR